MKGTGTAVEIVSNSGFNPRFSWQVGIDSQEIVAEDVYFRVTIRPMTYSEEYSRQPNPSVIYEETGVSLNVQSGFGYWEFSFSKNVSTPNGPHRDYQLVVEAHNSNGETSAGNMVWTTGEAGWSPYPDGYDIIAIRNPRVTGIELVNNIDTYNIDGDDLTSGRLLISGITGYPYSNNSYLGPNGDVSIQFTSGYFNDNIVGGYLYTSTGIFPKIDAAVNTGHWEQAVKKTRFSFNSIDKHIYSPMAGMNLTSNKFGFVSISFYDKLDREYINQGIDIASGLYISNNALIYNDAAIGRLSLGGNVSIQTVKFTGEYADAHYSSYIDFSTATIISSGKSNDTTVIVYMYPDSGLYLNW